MTPSSRSSGVRGWLTVLLLLLAAGSFFAWYLKGSKVPSTLPANSKVLVPQSHEQPPEPGSVITPTREPTPPGPVTTPVPDGPGPPEVVTPVCPPTTSVPDPKEIDDPVIPSVPDPKEIDRRVDPPQ